MHQDIITEETRQILEEFKPAVYREKVQKHLLQTGTKYSTDMIKSVYLGNRSNSEIREAIFKVFLPKDHKLLQEFKTETSE